MSRMVYFQQQCPTCGRTTQIRVMYLGKEVVCRQCGSTFVACDPEGEQHPSHIGGIDLLRRAEELITAAESGLVTTSVH